MTVTIDLGNLENCQWRIKNIEIECTERWERVGGDFNMLMTVNRNMFIWGSNIIRSDGWGSHFGLLWWQAEGDQYMMSDMHATIF